MAQIERFFRLHSTPPSSKMNSCIICAVKDWLEERYEIALFQEDTSIALEHFFYTRPCDESSCDEEADLHPALGSGEHPDLDAASGDGEHLLFMSFAGPSSRAAVLTPAAVLGRTFSRYCIRRYRVTYFLENNMWQKFLAPLTCEQRYNLQLQTYKRFIEQFQAISSSFDLDDELPLNVKEVMPFLLPSEVAACSIISVVVLRWTGGAPMLVDLRRYYNNFDFNLRIEMAYRDGSRANAPGQSSGGQNAGDVAQLAGTGLHFLHHSS